MNCTYCEQPARWVDNREIYGRRYGKSYMAWFCKPCGAWVGCHQNSRRPLGTLANAALRQERIKVHAVIDALWKSGRYTRRYVYRQLSDAFGREVHVGAADEAECREILKTARLIFST